MYQENPGVTHLNLDEATCLQIVKVYVHKMFLVNKLSLHIILSTSLFSNSYRVLITFAYSIYPLLPCMRLSNHSLVQLPISQRSEDRMVRNITI